MKNAILVFCIMFFCSLFYGGFCVKLIERVIVVENKLSIQKKEIKSLEYIIGVIIKMKKNDNLLGCSEDSI